MIEIKINYKNLKEIYLKFNEKENFLDTVLALPPVAKDRLLMKLINLLEMHSASDQINNNTQEKVEANKNECR